MAKAGGDGLRGRDKRQAALNDERTRPAERQDDNKELPEGLRRPRRGPYDKNVGRNEEATQLPKDQ